MLRKLWFNLAFMFIGGLTAGTMLGVHVTTVHFEKRAADLEAAFSVWHANDQLRIDRYSAGLNDCLDKLRAQHLESQKAAQYAGWYTLIYEPSATQSAVVQLANAAKPGLGAVLARLTPPNMQLRAVLPGYIVPIAPVQGIEIVYTQALEVH